MATIRSWRKTYGALKDTTTVTLAQVNSDFRDIDVAIVKATNHVECPPKERHLRKILGATSEARPRADVVYCKNALSKRLTKTHNWTVALKTLIVIHRILREGTSTFRDEILNLSRRGPILQLTNFKDDSSPIAWDCSAWVRTYSLFLEERLECFRVLKYDIEAERLPRHTQGQEKGYSSTSDLDNGELLEQMSALQQLLYRLIGCRPEGAAVRNYVIQYALALVLKESFKIYCAINDGIINIVDQFFDMPRHEAVKALEIYRQASQQAGNLSDFYEICKGLEFARNFQFPVLREPPQSFLTTMEEYIREAPRMVSVTMEALELPGRLLLTYKPEEVPSPSDETKPSIDEPNLLPCNEVASNIEVASPSNFDDGDLLGLNAGTDFNASSIEESNALALAILPSDSTAPYNSSVIQTNIMDPSGWELALVTTPSSQISSLNERQLAGGLDTLTLSSLYDEASYGATTQQPVYGTPAGNMFEMQDPFAMSHGIAPPSSVQMAAMAQSNPFAQYQPSYQQQQHQHLPSGSPNPFDDTGFGSFPVSSTPHPSASTNPFGSTSILY
ncbi:hypothetical protein GIB67_006102 [Kingdonia uniflora]|uniref:ENTH domain-containing protein n=1 Tax=Kingdonia uniflora TaxID=39325 RepID=A0A7J7LPY5_9MAGN|nr:hypothetical protein GIB67_006102 [Kingdonia uniflora]